MMIKVNTLDESFNQAYLNAYRALPVEQLETPRQYGARWREAYRCRLEVVAYTHDTYYIFDRDADYTWFMMRWS